MEEHISKLRFDLTASNVEELLNPNQGVTVIKPQGDIAKLLEELRKQAPTFNFVNSLAVTTTNVKQNFKAFGDFQDGDIWTQLGKVVSGTLRDGFEKLGYADVFQQPLALDDLTLQYYPQSKPEDLFALSPHRDQSGFINLVVVFLVYGPSAFFICKDREGTTPIEPQEIQSNPGDIVVMRAGGFNKDTSLRPCHFVGRVENSEGRLTLALRQITDDKTKLQKLECFFDQKFA
ncbi:MAG: hypothetical protein K9M11_02390 [Candidatus Pacebacteria bacterium]|nr:hypothetical protein [Candidatus Paceibacterota bacterium]